jgi:ATP/maltotriose-dependent transcriptional regulator MalT
VRARMAKSYEALNTSQQHAFSLLGLLQRDDISSWMFAALLGRPYVDDVIDDLVNRCLLLPLNVDEDGNRRYHLHSLLRDFARDRLKELPAEEQEQAMDRILGTWVDHARRTQSWAHLTQV